jgi:hypothetical protein
VNGKSKVGRFAPHNNICEGCLASFFIKNQQLEGETCQLGYHGLSQRILNPPRAWSPGRSQPEHDPSHEKPGEDLPGDHSYR